MDAKDIKTDDITRDLIFENGDFKIYYSDENHIRDIIESSPGWWKEFSTLGVSLPYYLNSTGMEQELKNKIERHIKSDGYSINTLTIDENFEIKIDCNRN